VRVNVSEDPAAPDFQISTNVIMDQVTPALQLSREKVASTETYEGSFLRGG
jgi:hypothetical protein